MQKVKSETGYQNYWLMSESFCHKKAETIQQSADISDSKLIDE